MDRQPLVSVLINNYNYGRFLRDAIDSALDQTYPRLEVIVVDDGSTDDSRQIIASYGDRVVPVLKENGGQASAFNAGFAACRGELLFFLDADDCFYRDKVSRILSCARTAIDKHDDVLIHHPLDLMDDRGVILDDRHPGCQSDPGNYWAEAKKYRYVPYAASTTSGIAITRTLGQRIFPLPDGFPSGADNFVVRASALLGTIRDCDVLLGKYRVHGQNHYWGNPKPVPKAFWDAEGEYLNERLVENGRAPIISKYRSMWGRGYYLEQRNWRRLLALSLEVPFRHLDQKTLRFSLKTLFLVAKMAVQRPVRDPEVSAKG